MLDTFGLYRENIRVVRKDCFLPFSLTVDRTDIRRPIPDDSPIKAAADRMRSRASKRLLGSLLAIAVLLPGLAWAAPGPATSAKTGPLAVIKGVVRDSGGSPIADATVAIFRVGTSTLLKQVRSAADGSFLAKILPGTYTVLAVAEGFNPVTLPEIEVGRAAQLNYGFKLERAGSGNTLPEKRLDRNNPKWVIRSAQTSRSIYQNNESADGEVEVGHEVAALDEKSSDGRPAASVAESFAAATEEGGYAGLNFATLLPLNAKAEVILAGQTGVGKLSPQRLEGQLRFRPADNHQLRFSGSVASLGTSEASASSLSQFSVQALDEWRVREGVILVFGVDYSKFIGAGGDFSLSPRLGFQFDIDSKTRFRSALTTQTDSRTWSKAIELEDAQVVFRDPVMVNDLVTENGRPQMARSSRLEFGIERVLDNRSSVETTVFFDTTINRGVGLSSLPLDVLDRDAFAEFTGAQNGSARGLRVVYSRRLSGRFSAAAGYSFGTGQKLSESALSSPSDLFQSDVFQTFFGQFEADLRTGTNVKTVFRLSPEATVFAIDPFQGRLAIYDPSLSVLVTQNLPTLGLPFHAEAVVDARNLFDFQFGIAGEEGGLRLNSQRRMLRGGILVRF
jgi:hypothetical protein